MKIRCKTITVNLISFFVILLAVFSLTFSLAGCSSMLSSRMPQGSVSMEQSYNNALNVTENGTDSSANDGSLKQVRAKVNTLSSQTPDYNAYTRTPKNEINSQFPQLPNPSLVMYIYPHQAGTAYNLTPVPGYSTVFPLYKHVYYAMPGEVSS